MEISDVCKIAKNLFEKKPRIQIPICFPFAAGGWSETSEKCDEKNV